MVAIVQEPAPEVVNVLDPFLEKPQKTIMLFAAKEAAVSPADVHVAEEVLACPLLEPIGVPVS